MPHSCVWHDYMQLLCLGESTCSTTPCLWRVVVTARANIQTTCEFFDITTRKSLLDHVQCVSYDDVQIFWRRANMFCNDFDSVQIFSLRANIWSLLRARNKNIFGTCIVPDYDQSFCHEQVQVFWFRTKILRRCGLRANILTACKFFDITACKYLLQNFKYWI